MVDISIIIVSWNTKILLQTCLQSVYDTIRHITFEVIVVDNDSSDGSVEMVTKEFPQVKLICNKKNLGFAKANNIGIKVSQGNYICLVNSDVVVLNNCIETMFSYIDSHPTIGISGPKVLNPDKTLQRSFKRFPTIWNALCRASALDTLFPKSKSFASAQMTYFSGDTRANG